jgi:hypothetical protein
MPRHKFQFSNRSAQAAEALLNAKEARELADRHAPKHLRESEQPETTAAGACFRNVTRILAGKGKK